MSEPNLSLDGFFAEPYGPRFTHVIYEHPQGGGPGVEVWRRTCSTEHNSIEAAEAAYQRLMKRGPQVYKSPTPAQGEG